MSAEAFIAGATKRVTLSVFIPEMNTNVVVQKLNVGEYDECVDLATRPNADGHLVLDRDLLHQLTVVAAIESPKLGPEAIAGMSEWDANIMARILLAIRGLSEIREGAADAAMSRFPAGAA